MTEVVEKELRDWLRDRKKVVIAGIGNPIRQDDYLGLKIVEGLQGKVSENVCLLECETVPESYLLDIEQFNPSHVLLIDAAFFGSKPGNATLVDAEQIGDSSSITTHMLPLKIFCQYIKQATGAKVALLLIQPKSMEFGEGLSSQVQAATDHLIDLLIGFLR